MNKEETYLKGKENWAIRMMFYINSGMNFVDRFKSLIIGLFALYFTLKLTNILWLVLMFAVSIPILGFIGYYNIHRMAKINEWLNIRFSTHFGIQQFTYIEQQVKLLERIEKLLQKLCKTKK